VFPHLDQVLRCQADFFAVHANDYAGVGSDGKSAADQAALCMVAHQLTRRRNPVAKTTNEQGLGCLRHPQDHRLAHTSSPGLLTTTLHDPARLKVTPGCCKVPFGGEQEVNRVAALINGAVKVLLLTGNFDVGLIHSPAGTNKAFAATKDELHNWQNFQGPAMHGRMIDKDASLLNRFLQMAKLNG